MNNQRLVQLLESVLGKSKPTSGGNISFFSPFKSHYKPKLEVRVLPDENGNYTWHCWISDKKGKSIYTLFKQLNLPEDKFKQLNKILDANKYRTVSAPIKTEEILQLPNEYKPLWIPKNNPHYKNAIYYLKTRGISIFDIIRYRIGYCESGKYGGRIIIPSYDIDGNLNYFVSRTFYKHIPNKHKNPNVSKDIIGFGMMINWNEPIVLTEGAFDAMAIKRNVIPLFGKIIQPTLQKKIIEEHVKDIYICLDNDAIRNSLSICEKFMAEGLNVYLVKLDEQDASDLGFEEMTKRIEETQPMTFEKIIQYKMDLLWK